MKKTILLIVLLGVFTLSFAQQKASRYALKSGHVEYSLSGNTSGTKTLWWDDYGDKTYTEIKSVTETRILGMKSTEETHSINITLGDKYWSVDLLENSGQKGTLPYYDDAQEYAEDMTEAEAKQLENDILAAFGGERLGTENFLGYPCEVMSVMGAKSWIYKGVVLKSEAKVLGIVSNETATSFKKNCTVSSSRFQAPTDIEYTDVDAMQAQYYGQMSGDDYEEDNSEDTDSELTALDYSYDEFLSATAPLSQKGYMRTMTDNSDGQYMALFMKRLVIGLTILATSEENIEGDWNSFAGWEKFSHNNHTCYYGSDNSSDNSSLVVHYPEHEMLVIYSCTIDQSKEAFLKQADACTF